MSKTPLKPSGQSGEPESGKDWIGALFEHPLVVSFFVLFGVVGTAVTIYAFGASSGGGGVSGEVSGPSASLVAGDLSPVAPGISIVECELDVEAVPLVGEQLKVDGAFRGSFCEAFELRVSADMSTGDTWAETIHSCGLTNWQNLVELWMELDKPTETWVGLRVGENSTPEKEYLAYPAPSFDEQPFKIRYIDIVSQVDRLLVRFDMFGYDRESEPFIGSCSAESREEGPGFSIWWYP